MTQIPAGWYPDPDPSQPEPKGQRYWDGTQWTEHVHRAAAPQSGYPPMGAYPAAYPALRATTPDGEPLAGWWQRVAASLLDTLILTPIVVIVGLPWWREIVSAYADFFDEAMRAAERGGTVPDQGALLSDIAWPFVVLSLIGLGLNFAYNAGFLKWRAATPGKMVVGLRVRLRDVPGPLSWATVLKRWVGQNWFAVLGAVPVIGWIVAFYPWLDGLWPLWDDKKQALHDKVARTNVVRTRA